MDEISVADITQQYHKNIIRYKGALVYVTRVFEDRRVKIINLMTQEESIVVFRNEDFTLTKARLGMVNINDSVLYVTRIPVRKFGMGINGGNISIQELDTKYPLGRMETVAALRAMSIPQIARTLNNVFPSFAEAMKSVALEPQTTKAFDRQFAVNSNGEVFYKSLMVGYVQKGSTSVKQIEFHPAFSHLTILLEGNHEKTVRNPCA